VNNPSPKNICTFDTDVLHRLSLHPKVFLRLLDRFELVVGNGFHLIGSHDILTNFIKTTSG
jgi:hypothetical protein